MKKTGLVTIALLAVAAPVSAQTASGGRAPVVIDMDADVIEGDLHKPDVVMVPKGVKREFRSLIQMRKSFSREMLASVGQVGSVQGAGSSIGK